MVELELLEPELELPLELDPELLEPELELPLELPLELEPELEDPELPVLALLPEVVATDALDPFPRVVLFPSPLPVLSFEPILDKSENIGLSLLVIPYAATAAAIHNTIIIEIITFALSNFIPPEIIY